MNRRSLSRHLTIAAAIAASFAAAHAGERAQSFKDATAISLRDFTGTVEVAVGGTTVDVTLTDGARTHSVDLSVENGTVVIAGEKRPRNFQLYREIDWDQGGDGAFRAYLEDYPHLAISAPAGTDLAFDDAIVMAAVGSLKSKAEVGGGYVEATFGDMQSADISIGGAGDIAMGAIAGALAVSIGGSGDFEALSAGSADFSIGGSGDIRVGPVAQNADVAIGGSGDVDIASVGGAIEVSIHGSGDVYSGEIAKGADLSIAGSGDIALDRINGPAAATIAGNGDIGVEDGRAEDLKVTIAGSGDFTFGGVSTNLQASIVGSGAISVAKNEGSLSYSSAGSGGEVIVGGKSLRTNR